MRLEFLGHACFRVTTDAGVTILLDPYRPGALGGRIAHGPITAPADIVAVTHYHEDHGWIGGVPGQPRIVDGPAVVAGIELRCAWLPHDGCGGAHMGLTRMLALDVDGITVLHPGDLGRPPTDGELAALGPVDLLLLPVGGRFTLGVDDAIALMLRLAPRWTVPMHYDSDRVRLGMGTRDAFLAALPEGLVVHTPGTSTLTPAQKPGVVVLEPAL